MAEELPEFLQNHLPEDCSQGTRSAFSVEQQLCCLMYVADVAITDNSSEIYDKLNGKDGVIVSLNKQSTYATAEVSNNINSRFRELEAEYDDKS